MLPRTTRVHFEIFKSECLYWIAKYGFSEYDVTFLHKDITEIIVDHLGKTAVIKFESIWTDEVEPLNEYSVRKAANHEIYELLVSKLDFLANERFGITEHLIEESRHETINRLQNAHFNQSLQERGLKIIGK